MSAKEKGKGFGLPPTSVPATVDDFVAGASVSTNRVPGSEASTDSKPGLSTPPAKEDEGMVYKAVSLRLNKERYKRLKIYSAKHETSIQQILTEAVDAYLDIKGA